MWLYDHDNVLWLFIPRDQPQSQLKTPVQSVGCLWKPEFTHQCCQVIENRYRLNKKTPFILITEEIVNLSTVMNYGVDLVPTTA